MNSLRFTLPLLLIVSILSVSLGNLQSEAISDYVPVSTTSASSVQEKGTIAGVKNGSGADGTVMSIIPDDPYYPDQWALPKIGAFQATTADTSEKQPVKVAVLDTGIDSNQEDLQGQVIAKIDFTGSGSAEDVNGHGTAVAGIIAANTNNRIGIAGIDPAAKLLDVKVADNQGICQANVVAEGIIWAVDHGAQVINMSLEISDQTGELRDAIDYAWKHGVVLVAAASNINDKAPVYPAYFPQCISVVATRPDDTIGPLSDYPDWIDLAAPGFNIISTLPDNSYGYMSGTSFATAYVSGLAALLFPLVKDSDNDGLLNNEVRSVIEQSAIVIPGSTIKRIDVPDSLDSIGQDALE